MIQDITLYTYKTWHIQDITRTKHDTLDHVRHDTYVHDWFPLSDWIVIVPFDSCQVLPGYLISTHHSYVFLKSRGGSQCGGFHTDNQTILFSEKGQGEVVCRRSSMVGAWPWALSWRSHWLEGTPTVCHREWKKGQAVSCNSNWWWCVIAIFEVVVRNRYFHWQFCVISDPCVW